MSWNKLSEDHYVAIGYNIDLILSDGSWHVCDQWGRTHRPHRKSLEFPTLEQAKDTAENPTTWF